MKFTKDGIRIKTLNTIVLTCLGVVIWFSHASDDRKQSSELDANPISNVLVDPTPKSIPEQSDKDVFKSLTAGVTKGRKASSEVVYMDANYLFDQVRPAICLSVMDTSTTATVYLLFEGFRQDGHDKETAFNFAEGLVDATMQYGGCME
jgi:hypothetical protein